MSFFDASLKNIWPCCTWPYIVALLLWTCCTHAVNSNSITLYLMWHPHVSPFSLTWNWNTLCYLTCTFHVERLSVVFLCFRVWIFVQWRWAISLLVLQHARQGMLCVSAEPVVQAAYETFYSPTIHENTQETKRSSTWRQTTHILLFISSLI